MEKEIIKESVGEALQHAGEPTTITTEVIELDRDRVTSQTDVPPEVFEFNLNGVPCFPRCDVSVVAEAEKQGVIKKVMTKNGRVGAILCPAD